ncbi:MAG: CHAT domain-containing protein [Cyanobacteria bacterium P01_A01_bin.80]
MSVISGGVVYKQRKKVSVYINPFDIIVGIDKKKFALRRKTAEQAKLSFASQLYELHSILVRQQQKANSEIKSETDESKRQIILQDSLTLKEDICLEQLDKLRKIGASLRSELSDGIIKAFQKKGFLRNNNQQEPFLSFIEDIDREEAHTPILWDMMHEKGQKKFNDLLDERNWGRFWGFRAPITHWVFGREPSETIRLRKSFSAIHEELKFAVKEDKLLQKFTEKRHQNLAGAFRIKVNEELKRQLINELEIQSWWNERKQNYWLKIYLDELTKKSSLRKAKTWTEDTLISILKDCKKYYDLLHFACHCEASDKSEFLSLLEMKVGGAPISLDVATMAIELKTDEHEDESDWDTEKPGRLVFLNACDTGGASPSHEPPGFPYKWIDCQNACAVIVTLCKIPDYFAYAFAEKFYENLFKETTDLNNITYVSEALLATRRYFMEKHNNPFGLAYVLYAMPEAHVQADF